MADLRNFHSSMESMRRIPVDDRKAFGSESGCDKGKVSEDFSTPSLITPAVAAAEAEVNCRSAKPTALREYAFVSWRVLKSRRASKARRQRDHGQHHSVVDLER